MNRLVVEPALRAGLTCAERKFDPPSIRASL